MEFTTWRSVTEELIRPCVLPRITTEEVETDSEDVAHYRSHSLCSESKNVFHG